MHNYSVEAVQDNLKQSRAQMDGKGKDAVDRSFDLLNHSYEDSLKLFVKSIQCQDPNDPVKPEKMVEQLAQMSTAQAQYKTLKVMEEQNNLLRTGQVLNSAGLIGKEVEVHSDSLSFQNGQEVEIGVYIPDKINAARLEIIDEKGGVVFQKAFEPENKQAFLDAGKQKFSWKGEVNTAYGQARANEKPLDNGQYRIRVRAYDEKNNQMLDEGGKDPLVVPTTIKAVMTGSDFMGNVPKIMIGNSTLPLNAIVSIQDHKPVAQETAISLRQDQMNQIQKALQDHFTNEEQSNSTTIVEENIDEKVEIKAPETEIIQENTGE